MSEVNAFNNLERAIGGSRRFVRLYPATSEETWEDVAKMHEGEFVIVGDRNDYRGNKTGTICLSDLECFRHGYLYPGPGSERYTIRDNPTSEFPEDITKVIKEEFIPKGLQFLYKNIVEMMIVESSEKTTYPLEVGPEDVGDIFPAED